MGETNMDKFSPLYFNGGLCQIIAEDTTALSAMMSSSIKTQTDPFQGVDTSFKTMALNLSEDKVGRPIDDFKLVPQDSPLSDELLTRLLRPMGNPDDELYSGNLYVVSLSTPSVYTYVMFSGYLIRTYDKARERCRIVRLTGKEDPDDEAILLFIESMNLLVMGVCQSTSPIAGQLLIVAHSLKLLDMNEIQATLSCFAENFDVRTKTENYDQNVQRFGTPDLTPMAVNGIFEGHVMYFMKTFSLSTRS